MTLVLTLHTEALWQQAIQQQVLPTVASISALNANSTSVVVTSAVTLTQLPALLAQASSVLLVYAAPEQAIATLLSQGVSLQAAAVHWQLEIDALLTLHKQWRRKLTLVNLTHLTANNHEGLSLLAKCGWPLTQPLDTQIDTFYTLLAKQLLQQTPELNTLYQLLEISSVVLTEERTVLALDAILADYQTSVNEKQRALSDENVQLLNQLMQTQEALEQELTHKAQQENALKQLEQQRDEATQEHAAALKKQHEALEHSLQQLAATKQQYDSALKQQLQLQAESQTTQTENKNLLAQLMQVQEQLETALKAKQTLTQQLKQTQNKLADWQTKHADLTQENQLILAELMNVQECLEKALLDSHTIQTTTENVQAKNTALLVQLSGVMAQTEQYHQLLEKNKHDAISRDKQHKRELNRVQNQLRKVKARADEAEFKLANLQQDINNIQSSKAWKVAAPVRAISRLIHKEDKTKKLIQRDVALIITSELFDTEWYTQAYPDVAAGNINPAEHYLRFGAAEGRRPGPDFDGAWYLQRYPDVAETGINPLLHFVKFGRSEGRTASPKLLEDHSEQGEE